MNDNRFIRHKIQQTLLSDVELRNFRKKRSRVVYESVFQGKTIMNVDIQPEYMPIHFLFNWIEFLNKNYLSNNIVFLYNGSETLDMISKHEYQFWLIENGLDEDVLNYATFYDKGYAFFRYCIDEGVAEEDIVDLVKYMISKKINDSRDINKEMWDDFMKTTGHSLGEVRELLEFADDAINIPDLMDFLKDYSKIVLTGGGINECLKEVEIALLSMDKKYQILHQYTY